MLEAASRRPASKGWRGHAVGARAHGPAPVASRAFDVIVAHGIWNLAGSSAEFRRAVAEAARTGRPGAGLFVFTFSRTTLEPDAEAVGASRCVFTQFAGEPQCFLTDHQLPPRWPRWVPGTPPRSVPRRHPPTGTAHPCGTRDLRGDVPTSRLTGRACQSRACRVVGSGAGNRALELGGEQRPGDRPSSRASSFGPCSPGAVRPRGRGPSRPRSPTQGTGSIIPVVVKRRTATAGRIRRWRSPRGGAPSSPRRWRRSAP